MLQRLKIAFAQVKTGNKSHHFLHKIRQIVYSLFEQKKLLKQYTITESKQCRYYKINTNEFEK